MKSKESLFTYVKAYPTIHIKKKGCDHIIDIARDNNGVLETLQSAIHKQRPATISYSHHFNVLIETIIKEGFAKFGELELVMVVASFEVGDSGYWAYTRINYSVELDEVFTDFFYSKNSDIKEYLESVKQ